MTDSQDNVLLKDNEDKTHILNNNLQYHHLVIKYYYKPHKGVGFLRDMTVEPAAHSGGDQAAL